MVENPIQLQIINQEQDNGGISFRDLGRFIKLSAMRILLYVLCTAIVVGTIVGGVWLFSANNIIAYTRIELMYKGADEGLAPNGSVFNKDSIRSVKVLQDALEKIGLQDQDISLEMLREKMEISGVPTQEYLTLQQTAAEGNQAAKDTLINYAFFPIRYDIRINDIGSLGVDVSEARRLLDSITGSYIASFKNSWKMQQYTTDLFELKESGRDSLFDYMDYYDLYSILLQQISEELTLIASENPAYRSANTQLTVSDLLSANAMLVKKCDSYISYVLSFGVSKNADITLITLKERLRDVKLNLAKYAADRTNIREQLDLYKPNQVVVVDSINNITTTQEQLPAEYHDLQKALQEMNVLYTETEKTIELLSYRIEALENPSKSQTDIDYVENLLNIINAESQIFIHQVNDMITDYFDYKYGLGNIRIVQPAVSITLRSDATIYLYVLAVFELLAVIVALIVTHVKRSALSLKKKQTPPVT